MGIIDGKVFALCTPRGLFITKVSVQRLYRHNRVQGRVFRVTAPMQTDATLIPRHPANINLSKTSNLHLPPH